MLFKAVSGSHLLMPQVSCQEKESILSLAKYEILAHPYTPLKVYWFISFIQDRDPSKRKVFSFLANSHLPPLFQYNQMVFSSWMLTRFERLTSILPFHYFYYLSSWVNFKHHLVLLNHLHSNYWPREWHLTAPSSTLTNLKSSFFSLPSFSAWVSFSSTLVSPVYLTWPETVPQHPPGLWCCPRGHPLSLSKRAQNSLLLLLLSQQWAWVSWLALFAPVAFWLI